MQKRIDILILSRSFNLGSLFRPFARLRIILDPKTHHFHSAPRASTRTHISYALAIAFAHHHHHTRSSITLARLVYILSTSLSLVSSSLLPRFSTEYMLLLPACLQLCYSYISRLALLHVPFPTVYIYTSCACSEAQDECIVIYCTRLKCVCQSNLRCQKSLLAVSRPFRLEAAVYVA